MEPKFRQSRRPFHSRAGTGRPQADDWIGNRHTQRDRNGAGQNSEARQTVDSSVATIGNQ